MDTGEIGKNDGLLRKPVGLCRISEKRYEKGLTNLREMVYNIHKRVRVADTTPEQITFTAFATSILTDWRGYYQEENDNATSE